MDASRAQGTPQAEAGRDDPRVRREQVALLFESLKPAAIADAVLALALAAFFFQQTGRWQVLLRSDGQPCAAQTLSDPVVPPDACLWLLPG